MLYFEDLIEGQVFDLGSHTVTADEIIDFATRYDPQPFHVDPEAARESFYGGLIASGWHTASIYMRLLVDGMLNNSAGMGSPGVDELRWLKPVKPGDVLKGRFTVVEARPSRSRGSMGIVRGKGELVNQADEIVMSIISLGLFGRRQDQVSLEA